MKSNALFFAAGLVLAIFLPLTYTIIFCGVLLGFSAGARVLEMESRKNR